MRRRLFFSFFRFAVARKGRARATEKKKNSDPPPFTHNSISLSVFQGGRFSFSPEFRSPRHQRLYTTSLARTHHAASSITQLPANGSGLDFFPLLFVVFFVFLVIFRSI